MLKQLRIVLGASHVCVGFDAFLDLVLEEKVVAGTYMVVLVRLETLSRVSFFDLKLGVQSVYDFFVDRDRVYSYYDSFVIRLTGHQIEPRMLSDLIDCVSFLGVCVQNAMKEVLGLI